MINICANVIFSLCLLVKRWWVKSSRFFHRMARIESQTKTRVKSYFYKISKHLILWFQCWLILVQVFCFHSIWIRQVFARGLRTYILF